MTKVCMSIRVTSSKEMASVCFVGKWKEMTYTNIAVPDTESDEDKHEHKDARDCSVYGCSRCESVRGPTIQ